MSRVALDLSRRGSGQFDSEQYEPNWAKVWAISAIVWFLLAILEAATVYPMRLSQHRPLPFWTMFADTAVHDILGAVLTPVIYKLALKFSFSPKQILVPTVVHLFASVALALSNTIYHFALFPLHLSPDSNQPVTLSVVFGFAAYAWFLDTSTTYVPVLAIAYMVRYYQMYRRGETHVLKLDAQRARAELNFLRSQMNPHFLFNTLHSISSLMYSDPEGADRMISLLSDLLRMALQQTQQEQVELRHELAFVDRYLSIEKIRLGDRLQIKRTIESETLRMLVPPLILQPLVENAVMHGISQIANGGELSLEAKRNDAGLTLIVRNDGTLKAPAFRPPGSKGVAIHNIRERLYQIYGWDHTFRIVEYAGKSVVATIILPMRTAADLDVLDGLTSDVEISQ